MKTTNFLPREIKETYTHSIDLDACLSVVALDDGLALDYADADTSDFADAVSDKKFDISYQVLHQHGDAGGNPEIRFFGDEATLLRLAREMWLYSDAEIAQTNLTQL